MKRLISVIILMMLSLIPALSNAISFTQTQTEWYGDTYQKRVTFNFGKPITNITQAILETNVYDLEDDDSEFGYPPDHVDIKLNIEGYNVPGAFDTVCFRFANGTVSFNLVNLLGSHALEAICSDGIIIVDFLNAGTYQESYDINWVSLSIEGGASSPAFEVLNSYPSPAGNPRGLAWDGEYLWHSSGAGGQFIYKIDTSGNVVNQYNWPYNESYGMAFDGANLWIVDNSSDYVYQYSTDWNLLGSFPIPQLNGRNLHGTGLTWDGAHLWLSTGLYDSDNYILKLATSGEILQSYHPVNEQLADLAWDGTHLWATSTYQHKIYQISTNGEVLQTFNLGNQNPNGITYDGNFLWYVDREPNNMIYQVRIASGIITTSTTTSIINPITTTITPITTTTPIITTSIGGCTYGSCITTGECTAAYGTGWACINGCCETTGADCPISFALEDDELQLDTIRSFRDNVLKKSKEGQEIIRLYYQWSPIIVKLMEQDEEFKNEMQDIIDEVLPLIE